MGIHTVVSIDNARNFVHANGMLWERALWDFLFGDGPVERVHQCLLCYKNSDGGWGHGLEHDIKAPMSNPLMLEFLLSVVRDTRLPVGKLLDGTPEWVERVQCPDGSLQNPPGLLDYPHAPWWTQGQSSPDSITGNLMALGLCPPNVKNKTRTWVLANLTMDAVRSNDWLFLAYHAFDYFMNVSDFPNLDDYRAASLENIFECALVHENKGEKNKLFPLLQFAAGPESLVAQGAPAGLIDRVLDYAQSTQRDDGGWGDEHGLSYWQPYFSTVVLLALNRFGRV